MRCGWWRKYLWWTKETWQWRWVQVQDLWNPATLNVGDAVKCLWTHSSQVTMFIKEAFLFSDRWKTDESIFCLNASYYGQLRVTLFRKSGKWPEEVIEVLAHDSDVSLYAAFPSTSQRLREKCSFNFSTPFILQPAAGHFSALRDADGGNFKENFILTLSCMSY